MYRLLLVLAAGLMLVAVACGGGDDDTVDIPGGGQVSTSDDIPDEFPDDFPVYDGADVQGSITGEDDDREVVTVTWQTDDSQEDVQNFYEEEFENGPWEAESTGTFSGGLGSLVARKGDKVGSVLIAEADGKTQIVVSIGDAEGLGDSGDGDGTDDGDSGDGGSGDEDEPTPDSGDSGGDEPDAELPEEAELADDFPTSEVPLPDGARVTSSSSFATGGVKTFFAEFYSEDSIDELADYYAGELTEAEGWGQSFTTEQNGEKFASYIKGEDAAGVSVNLSITPSEVDGYNKVALTVTNVPEN
jgi:hypothetical protein